MSIATKTKQNKSNLIQVRLDDNTKKDLENILSQLGLTTSQAVLLYIKQIVMKKKIPFEISLEGGIGELEDGEMSQKELEKITGLIVSKLDEGEEIPPMKSENERPFEF